MFSFMSHVDRPIKIKKVTATDYIPKCPHCRKRLTNLHRHSKPRIMYSCPSCQVLLSMESSY